MENEIRASSANAEIEQEINIKKLREDIFIRARNICQNKYPTVGDQNEKDLFMGVSNDVLNLTCYFENSKFSGFKFVIFGNTDVQHVLLVKMNGGSLNIRVMVRADIEKLDDTDINVKFLDLVNVALGYM